MAERIMMALGDFRFEVGTAAYQTLTRAQGYRWVPQSRVGRVPALQFVGPDLETVELHGAIFPAFMGGLGQIAAMQELAGLGVPLDLVDGTGQVLGLWCILSVNETATEFTEDGMPRRQDFILKLTAYGEDEQEDGA
ncbi:phage tail protein [Azospirillum sp.]|uniref:phage tail protein n=1 Tax=Azospirillum sp. TaxID=34012 RepID=UPI002D32AB5C|nr:phage tail protein [Azospirillum sp.]HYD66991.1 phage tail protein [Azospirillum sp.]